MITPGSCSAEPGLGGRTTHDSAPFEDDGSMTTVSWLADARRIADDTLFPAAIEVDLAGRIPRSHLDLLATEGMYGLAAPADEGGVGLERFDVIAAVVATLAGGCLATTFVWIQHLAPLITTATGVPSQVTAQWLGSLTSGERRAGIAMAGVRPGPGRVHARRVPGGFALTGTTAWVTGWGLIDTLMVGAVDEADVAHFFLMDVPVGNLPSSLTAVPIRLLAVQASSTVTLTFTDHLIPTDRLAFSTPYADWAGTDASGSALNGFLSTGVAERCARLIRENARDHTDADAAAAMTAEVEEISAVLLAAEPSQVPVARARASLLAAHAADELMIRAGSRSVLVDQHAQRLYREAGFLLVFASRPAIKQAMLEQLSRA